MRDDLNKLLCERERIGHSDKFHNYRGLKKFNPRAGTDGENVGGRESMKKRYHTGWGTKSFNENLNPLYGAVRKAVGRKWDKFYSELCKTFNMNLVINRHILIHLDQYVEHKGVYVDADGDLYVRGKYGGPDQPIKGSSTEYFVDPRDGILKRNKWYKNYKAIQRQRAAEAIREKEKVFREIDKHTVLRFIDDVWYHFEMLPIPPVSIKYVKPYGFTTAKIGWALLGKGIVEKTWEELNQTERERYGRREVQGSVRDVFTGETVYVEKNYVRGSNGLTAKDTRYHAKKQTASHKMLKKAGIV